MYVTREADELVIDSDAGNSSSIMDDYNTKAPQNPVLYTLLYDHRLNTSDVSQALDCGVIGWTEVPALGSNTFTIAASMINDPLGLMLKSEEIPEQCRELVTRIYGWSTPYTQYNFRISSSGTAYENYCDVSRNPQTQGCLSQILIRYSTFITTKMKSVHETGKKEILIDIGSIVGAIQFLTWFLTIYMT